MTLRAVFDSGRRECWWQWKRRIGFFFFGEEGQGPEKLRILTWAAVMWCAWISPAPSGPCAIVQRHSRAVKTGGLFVRVDISGRFYMANCSWSAEHPSDTTRLLKCTVRYAVDVFVTACSIAWSVYLLSFFWSAKTIGLQGLFSSKSKPWLSVSCRSVTVHKNRFCMYMSFDSTAL